MKLFAEGIVSVEKGGWFSTILRKSDEFRELNSRTISLDGKYLDLPEGTKLEITIKIVKCK